MNSVEVIELKRPKLPLTVILQILFSLGVLVSGIVTLFWHKWLFLFYGTLTLTLFTTAWNQRKSMHKKWMFALYIGAGIITLVSMILELL